MSSFGKKSIRALFFPVMFSFMEIAFHIYYYGRIDLYVLFAVLFAFSAGFAVSALTGFFSRKANIIIAWIATLFVAIFCSLQMVYGHIFTKFISLSSVVENAGDASEFWKQALHGIIDCIPGLIFVLIIPIAVLAVMIRKNLICGGSEERKQSFIYQGICLGIGIVFNIIAVLMLLVGGKENFTAYDLYHNDFMLDLGIERLGVITGTQKDIYGFFFGDKEDIKIEDTTDLSSLIIE